MTEIGRDERAATVKRATFRTSQTRNGGGFLALETPSNNVGEAYFYAGRTMAVAGSILGDAGDMRLILQAGRQAQRTLDDEMNNDPALRDDGSLVDADAIKNRVEEPLEALIFRDPEFMPESHASRLSVGDPTLVSNVLSVPIEIKRKGRIKAIISNLGISEVTASAAEEA